MLLVFGSFAFGALGRGLGSERRSYAGLLVDQGGRDGSVRTERRDKKNDVVMMSKLQPFLRATPSARGIFGVSMKPKRSSTRRKDVPIGSMLTRSAPGTWGLVSICTVSMAFCSCSTL
jgi:hypothetical protein